MLDRRQIAELLPHAGEMVLLDAVEEFDETKITCSTDSHRRHSNPLRRSGFLPAVAGIEYAAQAAAVHGALQRGGEPLQGYLASVRSVCFAAESISVPERLVVSASRVKGETTSVIYRFTLRAGEINLVTGRLAVIFAPEPHTI